MATSLVRPSVTLVGHRSTLKSSASGGAHHHRQLCAVVVTAPGRVQALTSFSGQRLTRQSTFCPLPCRQNKRTIVKAHGGVPGATPGPTPPNIGILNDSILDDISRWAFYKTKEILTPYFPKDFDVLAWLPDGIHNRVHSIELPAIILLREILHYSLFYLLFCKVDSICRRLSWIYTSNTDHKEHSQDWYDNSSFKAAAEPLRFLIVVWAGTRLAHFSAPVLKLKLQVHVTAKIRAVGLIYAATWFLFKWKSLYVDKLVSTYRLDAPRIYAFDKVVTLLMAFVAASLMGEITGFALRSLLAVGGFSGVALGLASKEIVSNFFGGAVLFATRPFVIGERIKMGNFSGYVQDIGFLQTKILSQERVPMVVPNQNFINQVITNYSRAANRLMDAEFPLRIQDIFLVDGVTSKVVQFLKNHPDVDSDKSTPVCYLKHCTGSNCNIAVTAVIRAAGGSEFYKVQQSILLQVAEIIISEGAMIGGNSSYGSSPIPALASAVKST